MRVDARQLARAGYTYIGRLYSEMDCQAFVERCLYDCGLKINLAGSNAWFRRMDWTGTPEECVKRFGRIPVGAFLFILEQDGREPEKYRRDGIGNASHIGIYTGAGKGAIHSSASKGSVVESRFAGKSIQGGWNRVGLWREISYSTGINAALGHDPGTEEKGDREMTTAIVALPAMARGNDVNLREGPGRNYGIKMHVPVGAEVQVIEDQGQWCQIGYGNVTGWMMANYLEYPGQAGEASGEGLSIEDHTKIDRALSEAEAMLIQIQEKLETIGSIVGRG